MAFKKITCEYIKKYLSDNNYTCQLVSNEYINCDEKLKFECKCGEIFFASWSNIKKMSGLCKKCSTMKKMSTHEYIQDKIDNLYGLDYYELINVNGKILTIEHKECNNIFNIRKDHFFKGQGCKFCNAKHRDYGSLSNETFLMRVEKYFEEYEFLTEYKNNHTPVSIRCKKCGRIFSQIPAHIFDRGVFCSSCNSSIGEQNIERYLKSNKIFYEKQYRFDDCRDKKPLPFDFYLPNYNLCIEYQRQQHYSPIGIFGGENRFNGQIIRDNIKREYCRKNRIILVEISYLDFKNIDKILDGYLLCIEEVV